MIARVLRAIATADQPMTSREVAAAIGMNYERNFNKREKRYARKLAGIVLRRRLTADEMTIPTRLLHWQLDDRWRGCAPVDIVRAFEHPATCTALVPKDGYLVPEISLLRLSGRVNSDAHREGETTCPTS